VFHHKEGCPSRFIVAAIVVDAFLTSQMGVGGLDRELPFTFWQQVLVK